MAAILDFTQKRGFPQGGFSGVLSVVLSSPTEANYVEKNLLTFLSIIYFGICTLKNAIFLHFFGRMKP